MYNTFTELEAEERGQDKGSPVFRWLLGFSQLKRMIIIHATAVVYDR